MANHENEVKCLNKDLALLTRVIGSLDSNNTIAMAGLGLRKKEIEERLSQLNALELSDQSRS